MTVREPSFVLAIRCGIQDVSFSVSAISRCRCMSWDAIAGDQEKCVWSLFSPISDTDVIFSGLLVSRQLRTIEA